MVKAASARKLEGLHINVYPYSIARLWESVVLWRIYWIFSLLHVHVCIIRVPTIVLSLEKVWNPTLVFGALKWLGNDHLVWKNKTQSEFIIERELMSICYHNYLDKHFALKSMKTITVWHFLKKIIRPIHPLFARNVVNTIKAYW